MEIKEITNLLQNNAKQYEITLYAGATEFEIKRFEGKMKIQLPDDLKNFYKFCNGFESAEDL